MAAGVRTPKEIREQILNRIKNDHISVPQVAKEFGLSDNTIYGWIHGKGTTAPNILEVNVLKRKIDSLYLLIGELTAQLADEKKKRGHKIYG